MLDEKVTMRDGVLVLQLWITVSSTALTKINIDVPLKEYYGSRLVVPMQANTTMDTDRIPK